MSKINIKLFAWSTFCLVFLSILVVTLNTIFVVISPPKVISLSPENEASDVVVDSLLTIKFNKPLMRQELRPSIFPETLGEWRFTDSLIKNHLFKTLVFVPANDFKPATKYLIRLENIKGFGLNKSSTFQFTFETQPLSKNSLLKTEEGTLLTEAAEENKNEKEVFSSPEATDPEQKVTMLEIPLDWQDYPLSCETASLKMALASKEVFVSEDEIMRRIGSDLTPRKGNVWGDPYQVYVGNIKGKMCQTGYGVYWPPVAQAARSYQREAEAFSNWNLRNLTREIEKGNPVIVWGVLPTGTLTDCSWYTKKESI